MPLIPRSSNKKNVKVKLLCNFVFGPSSAVRMTCFHFSSVCSKVVDEANVGPADTATVGAENAWWDRWVGSVGGSVAPLSCTPNEETQVSHGQPWMIFSHCKQSLVRVRMSSIERGPSAHQIHTNNQPCISTEPIFFLIPILFSSTQILPLTNTPQAV